MAIQTLRKSCHAGNEDLLVLIGDEDPEGWEQQVPCTVFALDGFDWDADLTPWPAPPVFPGRTFSGHGDELISCVEALDILQKAWRHRWIGGYSLAGLFALYMCTKTDLFDGCISCSGSLWYDGFLAYLKEHPVQCDHVYLSLGDREKQTRNERMKTVEQCHREAERLLSSYCDSTFVLNKGGHFQDPGGRMVKGVRWMMERK